MLELSITQESLDKVNELIREGWEFMLSCSSISYDNETGERSWEADFTRKVVNRWDNHESGFNPDPNVAIAEAYDNIRNGRRLKEIQSC